MPQLQAFSAFGAQSKTAIGTTAVQLGAAVVRPNIGILLKADAANSGTVWVGHANTVGPDAGFPLAAGEALLIEVDKPGKIWVEADAASQKVHWIEV